MTDFEDRCYDHQGFRIPVCWSAVIYGDDECICDGSPNAIAMDRRWRAWVRLEGIRERKREERQRIQERQRVAEAKADGLGVLPGAKPFRREGPFVRVPLRAIRGGKDGAA